MNSDSKIHILYVERHADPGGAQLVLMTCLRVLDRNLFEPIVVFLGKGTLIQESKKLGIITYVVEAGRLFNIFRWFVVIYNLICIIKHCKVDLVCDNGRVSHLYGAIAAWLTRVPCIWWVHGLGIKGFSKNGIIRWLSLRMPVKHIISNSRWVHYELEGFYPKSKEITLVYCGINLDRFKGIAKDKELKDELGIAQGSLVISLIARLTRIKGQDIFLKAAALIAQKYSFVKFLLVGGVLAGIDPEFPYFLQKMVKELNISSQVIMTGHRDDIERFYQISDIIVLTSTKLESFGLVLVEAMACGKPVVASKLSGPLEIIEDGRTGILVPPGDPNALVDAIERLIKDEQLRKEMGEAGAQRARQLFSDKRMAKDLAQVYLKVYAKNNIIPSTTTNSDPCERQRYV